MITLCMLFSLFIIMLSPWATLFSELIFKRAIKVDTGTMRNQIFYVYS